MQNDEKYMLRALELSQQALPQCRPNPPVGCVLVKNGSIISEGYTQPPGQHHAEAHAIAQYLENRLANQLVNEHKENTPVDFSDVTAYVTLEPCSFVGRTPSCANTLATLGVKRVVVAMIDPDPRNSGKGLDRIKQANIQVDVGICEDHVKAFISQYLIK
ncbi:bifunctional diaminohydroxyphosphoribosylaminopyrimidine deaminase/5-amino-6-(5-phosphoribosylamino)uracil reductase RibD [Photobacterium sanguinicancri]|uniref:Bifunctional diaminohydroxyphosphoribosylaminopyrimidine deaminase/5-amino-6-(5-phosphoribosylamino)uracil reductase RibD n=1 Tax=Photobacterium sanguinicancri TaxID=875932 RepID=A0AAW7YAY3_9GAMM|nr:bifunctional diaminohydroxyphosphoribosylaminopyrimidine deaminase/5-amino-6-(5-phosphoribosylamino)uracil reductase RibD [Photobacterium sanguinicancri]MDO6544886.1 bifunctional diaminohydroxyphosphoribosylaminopyrimidine deaminase/5-amino-6-(5-phosphoribosylamino)uracil reductase RibD [Photobacterium sanguinicancri]